MSVGVKLINTFLVLFSKLNVPLFAEVTEVDRKALPLKLVIAPTLDNKESVIYRVSIGIDSISTYFLTKIQTKQERT